MANPTVRVEVPSITPARGGLKAVANLVPNSDAHIGLGGVDYTPEACGVPAPAPGLCLPNAALGVDEDAEKEFGGVPFIAGEPFALYKGVECDLGGWQEYGDRASRGLELGESFGLESAIQKIILNGDDTEVLAGEYSMVSGVAALEQYAASVYGGAPTFHVSRYGTTFLFDKGVFDSDDDFVVTTKQGSLVANGGGYSSTGPGGVEAGPGQFWLYASGQVNIFHGDITVSEAKALPTNRAFALAERIYVPTIECFVAAVLVTTGGTP